MQAGPVACCLGTPDTPRLPACLQFTHRVFGLPPRHFYSRHLHMLQASSRPQHSGSGSSKGCDSFLNICPLLDLASSRDVPPFP